MLVEIYGGTLTNVGDELMLRKIQHELDSRLDDFQAVVYPRDLRYELRAQLGLRSILPGFGRGPLIARSGVAGLSRLAHSQAEKLSGLYGLVLPDAPVAVVTLSGFAFSDSWPEAAARAVPVFESYSNRRRPVILLPQALGPFENDGGRNAFCRIARVASLIYARDNASLAFAREACGEDSKVRRAYDITLTQEMSADTRDASDGRVTVVPNQRMLDRGPATWRTRYMDVMHSVIEYISANGIGVDILVHDRGLEDEVLASKLLAVTPQARLVPLTRALDARRHIAGARAVVASRYHALVGAFAHAVPSVGIGWAHKYQGLYDDFGLPQLCISEEEALEGILRKVGEICDPGTNEQIRASIQAVLPGMRAAISNMWDDVADTIRYGRLPARTTT